MENKFHLNKLFYSLPIVNKVKIFMVICTIIFIHILFLDTFVGNGIILVSIIPVYIYLRYKYTKNYPQLYLYIHNNYLNIGDTNVNIADISYIQKYYLYKQKISKHNKIEPNHIDQKVYVANKIVLKNNQALRFNIFLSPDMLAFENHPKLQHIPKYISLSPYILILPIFALFLGIYMMNSFSVLFLLLHFVMLGILGYTLYKVLNKDNYEN